MRMLRDAPAASSTSLGKNVTSDDGFSVILPCSSSDQLTSVIFESQRYLAAVAQRDERAGRRRREVDLGRRDGEVGRGRGVRRKQQRHDGRGDEVKSHGLPLEIHRRHDGIGVVADRGVLCRSHASVDREVARVPARRRRNIESGVDGIAPDGGMSAVLVEFVGQILGGAPLIRRVVPWALPPGFKPTLAAAPFVHVTVTVPMPSSGAVALAVTAS